MQYKYKWRISNKRTTCEQQKTMSTTTTSKKSKEPVKLPMYNVPYDSDGYVESFLITQEDEIKEFFNQFGFVVVRDAITPQDCTDTIDEIWTMLEKKSTFNRNDSESWKSKWPEDGLQKLSIVYIKIFY